jgi:hypothetical protein
MVVLSLLALIIILAYGFFGSVIVETQKEQAMLEIYRGQTAISNAYEMMVLNNGGVSPIQQAISSATGSCNLHF